MDFRALLFTGFLMLSTWSLSAQQSKVSPSEVPDTEDPDSTILIPTEFDNTLDNLLHTWMVERSDSSDCSSEDVLPNVPDSIYKLRLSKMPCLMEMPFNNSVRSFIELYTVRKRRQVEYMMGMSDYYFPIFEQVLGANNLPLELKYLPIIESALNTTIVSHMGKTFCPMQKKVALALYFFNSSNTKGVIFGCGPSSKVKKMVLFSFGKCQI